MKKPARSGLDRDKSLGGLSRDYSPSHTRILNERVRCSNCSQTFRRRRCEIWRRLCTSCYHYRKLRDAISAHIDFMRGGW